MNKLKLKQLIREAIVAEFASNDIDMALKAISADPTTKGLGAYKEDNFIIFKVKPNLEQIKALGKMVSNIKVGPHPEKPGKFSAKFEK
jgi:tetrahydromethanopterin S-methyltransferase subunit B